MSVPPYLPQPGSALETLIARLTPCGALTWRTLPAELPWTRPPGGGDRHPGKERLQEVLTRAGVKYAAAREYILGGPFTEVMVYSPRELARNHGHAARALEVAAEHDIVGTDLADIASRLELHDHQLPLAGEPGMAKGDPRGGRRYLSSGRGLLAALGVWPWVHVNDWSRTRRWWRDPAVHKALIAWHDSAWLRAVQKLAWGARARYSSRLFRNLTGEEAIACLEFRRSLAELGRQGEQR
jgi:hypothetical protein